MSSMSHMLLYMVLAIVLCSSSVSAVNIVDTSHTVTITGPNGIACIPEMITIQGTTNYNTDNRVIVEISPVGFPSASKTAPSGFSDAVATVNVQTGIGINFWKMSANTDGWQPGMYLIQASVVGKELIESEFITLEYCTDITQISFSLPTVSQTTRGSGNTAGSGTTSGSTPERTETPSMTARIETPTPSVTWVEPSEVPTSSAQSQSTPRSPSWFGLAALACLGAILCRKI